MAKSTTSKSEIRVEYSSPTEAAWGVTVGLVGMLGFIAAVGL